MPRPASALLRLRRRHHNRALQPLQINPIALARAPSAHRTDRVLDLPAVQIPRGELIHIGGAPEPGIGDPGEDLAPQDRARGGRERREEQVDVDSRAEGGVDGGEEVGGEEDDAAVVFEFAEEDGDEFVAEDVGGGALGHEDVGFVEEDDGVPFGGHLEGFLDVFAQGGGVGAQFFRLEVVEGAAGFVGHCLREERLACAGGPAEEGD